MKSKFLGVGLFCVVLFAAILAGYWDMLNTEKLTWVRDKATNAVGEIADVERSDTLTTDAASPAPPAGRELAAAPAPVPAVPLAADGSAVAPANGSVSPNASTNIANADPAPAASITGEPKPAFDILRVEPDGSTVLAGTAPAGSTVSLRDAANNTLGTEMADASGAFVVVLEKPLRVGDHQIHIDAKTKDGRALTSAETAIVSIPEEGRERELLAMVEAPNQTSRLISVPKAADAPVPDSPAAPEIATPPAGATSPEEIAAAAAVAPSTLTEIAMATPAEPPTAVPSDATVALAVDAVEIEGDAVYIAGSVGAGTMVRIYIDNSFLAQAGKLPDDRFLMATKSVIAAGNHIVRADELDGGGKVVARVEVPFVKPEGRAMAAVSSPTTFVQSNAQQQANASPGQDVEIPAAAGATASDVAAISASSVPAAAAQSVVASGQASSSIAVNSVRPDTSAAANTVNALAQQSASATATAPSDIAVTHQPALETVNARVIIRRGDSLWRISRNTYGRGARYTVIYLANGDQIRDPNRIYPGQVFRMPKDEEAAKP
jgi:nucleoid-associated protein YgaU